MTGPRVFHLGCIREISWLVVGVIAGTGREMTQQPHVYYDGMVGHGSGREVCN
jgi:hypothetical protein